MMNASDLNILYEDNHIIVVIKPANILSQKDNTNDVDMLELIKQYLKIKYNKPGNVYLGLVHRLDRRVSGVMVFAKTSKAASRLSEEIRNEKMLKQYYAILCGKIKPVDEIISYIKKVETKKGSMAVITSKNDKEAKIAKLDYKVLKYNKIDNIDYSLALVNLHTGRYNQIRAQFASINHPIINDFKYGYRNTNYNNELGLACVKMQFTHPTMQNLLTFEWIPEDGVWSKFIKEGI